MSVTTGIGYDAHRLAEGRPFILGGVRIPWDRGPDGHSDADVLIHAIIDALLGAAGLGDIGEHFPDSDPAYADADSMGLLRDVVALLGPREILHVDATVLLERPKIGPYRDSIRDSLAGDRSPSRSGGPRPCPRNSFHSETSHAQFHPASGVA